MKNKETTPLEYVSKHKDYIDYYIQKVKEDEEAYNQSLAETENLKTRLEWSKGILEHFKLEEAQAIEAFEKETGKCVHDWVDDGYDSHYTYYKCSKCELINKF